MGCRGKQVPLDAEESDSEKSIAEQRKEYIEKLEQWVGQARLWHNICAGFPQYYNRVLSDIQNNPRNRNYFIRPPGQNDSSTNSPFQAFQPDAYEFTIPPLWKRFVAEILDFVILFIIKMFVTFFILEGFNFLNIEHYGLEIIQKNFQNPKLVIQLSTEVLILEMIHRIASCCYEAYWLKGGLCATPGKWYMGLMVIHAVHISAINDQSETVVRVQPSTPLGLQRAFTRSVLKNLFVGFMLPVCFTLYVFRFNRTGYDVVANSLVVEWNQNFQIRAVN